MRYTFNNNTIYRPYRVLSTVEEDYERTERDNDITHSSKTKKITLEIDQSPTF